MEICTPDAAWERERLTALKVALDSAKEDERRRAAQQLRYLGTPAAVTEMAMRLMTGPEELWLPMTFGLVGSPHRAHAIRSLEALIEAKDVPVRQWPLRVLALLRFRGVFPRNLPSVETVEDADFERVLLAYQRARPAREAAYQRLLDECGRRLATALAGKTEAARTVSQETLSIIAPEHARRAGFDVRPEEETQSRSELIAGFESLKP